VPRHTESTLAAIKQVVDIVALIGDYLPLQRSGTKFKALCPFHNDHNPSLELNPERQSYKCWSCGAGGDIFDFVQAYERVDFPEALRMLAERAGIVLDRPAGKPAPPGLSKTDLFAANAWAEQQFATALAQSPEALAYVQKRGIRPESIERFHLGLAPDACDWLVPRARRDRIDLALLERLGLVTRDHAIARRYRERFRGRLIFPIHDLRGRVLGFGGRILPAWEERMAAAGRSVAKYVNSPETPLFQKRRTLYAVDLARAAARHAGWVAVVEGYTDVIAAHQAGLTNVVGTLGTALGDDHVLQLRRLADRVVLIFDGDEAGQKAADRALELFLGHEVDVRVLSLPPGQDPCDFLQTEGAEAFRARIERAVDPLDFALERAAARFDLDAVEGARQAAEGVLAVLSRVPRSSRLGVDMKVAKALDRLARRLRLPVADLSRRLKQLRQPARPASGRTQAEREPLASLDVSVSKVSVTEPSALVHLDPTDRELVKVLLNAPELVDSVLGRVAVATLRDEPLRAILRACFELRGEGELPTFERVALRLDDPGVRALAAGLLLPIDPAPLPAGLRPASWEDQLAGILAKLAERQWADRLRDLKAALDQTDPTQSPAEHQALRLEYRKLLTQRPNTPKKTAS
jgi:DNA primase